MSQKKIKASAQQKLEPEDYYLTDNGLLVFTKEYHLKRGYCCRSGCRHCPYGYKDTKSCG